MKASTYAQAKVREHLEIKAEREADNAEAFIRKHIPRFHQFLMRVFPNSKRYFQYALAANEDDRLKLTLLRGKKVIAKNF